MYQTSSLSSCHHTSGVCYLNHQSVVQTHVLLHNKELSGLWGLCYPPKRQPPDIKQLQYLQKINKESVESLVFSV